LVWILLLRYTGNVSHNYFNLLVHINKGDYGNFFDLVSFEKFIRITNKIGIYCVMKDEKQ